MTISLDPAILRLLRYPIAASRLRAKSRIDVEKGAVGLLSNDCQYPYLMMPVSPRWR